MTKQEIILERAKYAYINDYDFIPAMEVKRIRRFPTQYSNRCSELVNLGLLKRTGLIDGMMSFEITKKGMRYGKVA